MESEEADEGGTAPPPSTQPSETGDTLDRVQILLAASGIAGPLLYASVVIVLGFLRPGYHHLTQFISELGEVGAPNAIVMNIFGFILPGLLIIAFAIGLYRGISDGLGSRVGSALLAVGAFGLIGAALFPCSPGCEGGVTSSHFLAAGVVGAGRTLAPFALWGSLRRDSRWQGYASYSLVTGVVVVLGNVAQFFGTAGLWTGLGQRLTAGVLFLWIVVMAIHLLRLSLRARAKGTPGG